MVNYVAPNIVGELPPEGYVYLVYQDTDGTIKVKTSRNGISEVSYPAVNATSGIGYAFNNLTSGRTWKEKVILKGDFLISRIFVPSYCTIDASAAHVFQISGTNTNMIENSDSTSGNVDIEFVGGYWDGNRAGQTGGGSSDTTNLLWFKKCSHVNIHDGFWTHANYHCFRFADCPTDIRVTNNRIENFKQEGVSDQALSSVNGVCHGHIVANNYFTHNEPEYGSAAAGSAAVATVNVNDFVFADNICDTTMGGSCTTFNGLRQIVVGNIIQNGVGGSGVIGSGATSAGIVLAQGTSGIFDSSYSVISNNIVRNMGAVGIHVQNGWPSHGITIANNEIDSIYGDTGGFGIAVQDSWNTKIIGNTIHDCTCAGIEVNGNFISGSATIISGTANCIVTDNICYNNGKSLQAATFRRVGITVVTTNSGVVDNIVVTNNRGYSNGVSGTQLYGVHIQGSTNCIVHDNDFRDNASGAVTDGGNNVNLILYNNLNDPTNNIGGNITNTTIISGAVLSARLGGTYNISGAAGITFMAESGGTEVLMRWKVQDASANDYISFENITGGATVFAPTIIGQQQSGTNASLLIMGKTLSGDVSTNTPLIRLDGRIGGAPLGGNRPIVTISNILNDVYRFGVTTFVCSGITQFKSDVQLPTSAPSAPASGSVYVNATSGAQTINIYDGVRFVAQVSTIGGNQISGVTVFNNSVGFATSSVSIQSGAGIGVSGSIGAVVSYTSGMEIVSGFNWAGTIATSATSGTNGPEPGSVQGYITINISGALGKIPFFRV